MNTIGEIYRLTAFGESHGAAMGGVVDGMPAGIDINVEQLQQFVARRRPGSGAAGATARVEHDQVQLLSGIYQGKTLGTPIGFVVPNQGQRSDDYNQLAHVYRPSHADYTWDAKFGIRDPRGGGRASARWTVAAVVAGGLALQVLNARGITVASRIVQVGDAHDEAGMASAIEQAHRDGDTVGGIIECIVHGVPAGLGEPVFGKLHARLAAAMMSINAVHGFEYGDGFDMAAARGSQVMDCMERRADGSIDTTSNHSGGIQGGISNGEDIVMRVAFKPVPTLMRDLPCVDREGNPVTVHPGGRHDSCVLSRALPIVESMAAIVILDAYLIQQTRHIH